MVALEAETKRLGLLHFKSVSLVNSLILEQMKVVGAMAEMMLVFAAILDVDITKMKEVEDILQFQNSPHFAKANEVLQIKALDQNSPHFAKANEVLQIKALDQEKESELKQKIFEQIFGPAEVKELVVFETKSIVSLVTIFNALTKDTYDLNLTVALSFTELNSGLYEDKPIEGLEWDLLILLKNQFPDAVGSLEKLKRSTVLKVMASLTSNYQYHAIDLKPYKGNAL
eukprot:CAMPEP_0170566906 /NCGR_PEP_ID=MMETSP0211-20121228/80137_1 /TAXON_ID=311385 /ORGANISM="Pseudokeronopsis sp., Strain OXSARD2" /LENGTH=227 /DNA_ID=CAMNT_0010888213 /DNA_START=369 /DNA_END=1052 /DNA_ORIENTATION=-